MNNRVFQILNSSDVTFRNLTIQGGRTNDTLYYSADVGVSFDSVTNTLVEAAECANGITDNVDGNIVGQDPALGALQDNGGPTFTHALDTSSVAVDGGLNPNAFEFDQRGDSFPRVSGLAADMGAFETAGESENVNNVNLRKFLIVNNWRRPDRDHLHIIGFFDLTTEKLPRGTDFPFEGMAVTIDVGGQTFNFTLDKKGRGGKTFRASYIRRRNQLKFKISGNDGPYQQNFVDENLLNEQVKAAPRTVQMDLTMGEFGFSGAIPVLYYSKLDKNGKALAKNYRVDALPPPK